MAPTMEQRGRPVAEWKAILLYKRLKVNAGKSKEMVGSSGGKMIVNSVKSTVCKMSACGDLSLVAVVFR